jgi:hypothetical protein
MRRCKPRSFDRKRDLCVCVCVCVCKRHERSLYAKRDWLEQDRNRQIMTHRLPFYGSSFIPPGLIVTVVSKSFLKLSA